MRVNVDQDELDPDIEIDPLNPTKKRKLHSLNQNEQELGGSGGKHDPSLARVKLKSKDAAFMDSYLDSRLKSTRKSIREGMVFAMERP